MGFVNESNLIRAGITSVLTIANDTPDVVSYMTERLASFKYLQLDVGDFGTDPKGMPDAFPKAFDFIDEARHSPGGAVFVHCANGSNRSPTIVIAYVMHHKEISLQAAYNLVLWRRPHVQPLADNQR